MFRLFIILYLSRVLEVQYKSKIVFSKVFENFIAMTTISRRIKKLYTFYFYKIHKIYNYL
jgi:hypothetical protein